MTNGRRIPFSVLGNGAPLPPGVPLIGEKRNVQITIGATTQAPVSLVELCMAMEAIIVQQMVALPTAAESTRTGTERDHKGWHGDQQATYELVWIFAQFRPILVQLERNTRRRLGLPELVEPIPPQPTPVPPDPQQAEKRELLAAQDDGLPRGGHVEDSPPEAP